MTDQEIVQKLIERDGMVTHWFFYDKCRPLFLSLIKHIFDYPVEYDEVVNEIYLLLMEDNAARLRQFNFRSTICQWLKTVAIRHFIRKKADMIDDTTKEPPYPSDVNVPDTSSNRHTAELDIDILLVQMAIPRQAYVIRRLVQEDAEPKIVAKELAVTVANLYNIKKRAIAALTQMVINEK